MLQVNVSLTFKLLIQVALFDKVVYPLTFNDEQHVIGCVSWVTTT